MCSICSSSCLLPSSNLIIAELLTIAHEEKWSKGFGSKFNGDTRLQGTEGTQSFLWAIWTNTGPFTDDVHGQLLKSWKAAVDYLSYCSCVRWLPGDFEYVDVQGTNEVATDLGEAIVKDEFRISHKCFWLFVHGVDVDICVRPSKKQEL